MNGKLKVYIQDKGEDFLKENFKNEVEIIETAPKSKYDLLREGGRASLGRLIFDKPIGRRFLENFFNENTSNYLNFLAGEFLKKESSFKILDLARMGYYSDIVNLEVHNYGFDPLNIKYFLDNVLMFLNHFVREERADFPIEIDIAFGEECCLVSCMTKVSGYKEGDIVNSFKGIKNTISHKNLLGLAHDFTNVLDITFLKNESLRITGCWFEKKEITDNSLLVSNFSQIKESYSLEENGNRTYFSSEDLERKAEDFKALEDSYVIKGATDHISEEIERVKGFIAEASDSILERISSLMNEEGEDELDKIIVKSFVDEGLDEKDLWAVKNLQEKIKERVEERGVESLFESSFQSEFEEEITRVASGKSSEEKDELHVKSLGDKKDDSQIIDEYEKRIKELEGKLRLKDEVLKTLEKSREEVEIEDEEALNEESEFSQQTKNELTRSGLSDYQRKILNNALDIEAMLKDAQRQIRKLEIASDRKDNFFQAEFEKMLRKLQVKTDIADKAKQGVLRVASRKQNEIDRLKKNLDDLNQDFHSKTAKDATRIKELEQDLREERARLEKEMASQESSEVSNESAGVSVEKFEKVSGELKMARSQEKKYKETIKNLEKQLGALQGAIEQKAKTKSSGGGQDAGQGYVENRDKLIKANSKILELKQKLYQVEKERDTLARKNKNSA